MKIVASSSNSVRASILPWQRAMQTAIRDGLELCRHLNLSPDLIRGTDLATDKFPVFAPLGYVAKMRLGDPHDPLLRQVLPIAEELNTEVGFTTDPVGDHTAKLLPGLLRKYSGRVLMITTGACAIHCRYCFRRHFPYHEGPGAHQKRLAAVEAIGADPSIEEVILSGGDPLTLPDSQLSDLAARLAEIPHLRRIRVHTRLPIVIPERVTSELCDWLSGTRLTPIMVIHANHPRELDDELATALSRMTDRGIPLLNQSVLLSGVNDDLETLVELSKRLIDLRVMPYYLHQLDRVLGAGHFEVPIARGIELMEQMRGRLPGYAIPRYVQERPGDTGKSWL